MNRFKKALSSPRFSRVSTLIAVALLLFASIGGARSALQYFSEDYKARMELYDIGVALVENGDEVSSRTYSGKGIVDNQALDGNEQNNWDMTKGLASVGYDELLQHLPGEDDFKLGQAYDEVLHVRNTGTIDQYVRVTIYKYWLDENNNPVKKNTDLSPDDIKLEYDNVGSSWVIDEEASTPERTVLYYTKLLKCKNSGGPVDSEPFTKTIKINEDVARTVSRETIKKVEDEDGKTYTTIKTIYSYDGYKFCVEAKVDAVQDHHADDAVLSAWGREVTVSNGVLSLK